MNSNLGTSPRDAREFLIWLIGIQSLLSERHKLQQEWKASLSFPRRIWTSITFATNDLAEQTVRHAVHDAIRSVRFYFKIYYLVTRGVSKRDHSIDCHLKVRFPNVKNTNACNVSLNPNYAASLDDSVSQLIDRVRLRLIS